MSTEHGTPDDSDIQVRHDGRELRLIVAGEVVGSIEGNPYHLQIMLRMALDKVRAVTDAQDQAEDDDEPAVCVHCDMALDWLGPREGWVAKRAVPVGGHDAWGNVATMDVEEPVCEVAHDDGNTHRPITPAEREAREQDACPACGDPGGPCEIGCQDPDCISRDCESHDACEDDDA